MSQRNDVVQKWVHFTAIGGTGMGALAFLLKKLGYFVTGSDQGIYPPMSDFIEAAEIPYKNSYSIENLKGKTWGLSKDCPDLVVVGNAISKGHPEAEQVEQLLKEEKTQRLSFAQALYQFAIKGKESFVVCGTHGKSTTTSLLTWALETMGHSPGFFIGAIPSNFGVGSRLADGDCFACEGDEYDTAYWDKVPKFSHYHPDWVLCTGVEFDHADIYSNLEEIENAFVSLIPLSKKGWVLVDDESAPLKSSVNKLADELKMNAKKCLRYGFAESSPYRILKYEMREIPWKKGERALWVEFCLGSLGVCSFQTTLSGRYNLLNLLGVLAVLIESNRVKDVEQIQEYIRSFKGLKRRQEVVFEAPSHVLVDDFAHHPTAVSETIKGLREKYPEHHLVAFFEPRSATSARNIFFQEYLESFQNVDALFLRKSLKKNVPDQERLQGDQLCLELEQSAAVEKVAYNEDVDFLFEDYKQYLAELNSSKVLTVVMSNSSFDSLLSKLKNYLSS